MRIVVLTWEYPPRVIGEVAHYAQVLCEQLARKGFETHVVTYNEGLRGVDKEPSGVTIHRVGNPVQTHLNILSWTLALTEEFERACADIHHDIGPVDLIDCHEWISVPAAVSLRNALGIPYVMTVESLEELRSVDSSSPLSLTIRHFERLGTSCASFVIVKSKAMKETVLKLHDLPREKVRSIPQTRSPGEATAHIYVKARSRKVNLVTT